MLSKEEIEKARSNILRSKDIESASIILEAIVLDNYIEIGGRVNILKIATRQILNFIEENKNKGNLDYIKEKVKANNKVQQLESEKQKLIEKLEEDIKKASEIIKDGDYRYIQEVIDEAYERLKYANKILKILKGEKDEKNRRIKYEKNRSNKSNKTNM